MNKLGFFLLFTFILILAAVTHWPSLYHPGNFTYDEGVYLMTLKAVRNGQSLYQDIYYSQLPLYIKILDLFSSSPEISIPSVRWVTWFHFPLLLAAVGYLGFCFFGPLAAMVSMIFIYADPAVHALGHVVLGNLPAVAWAVAAWAILEFFIRQTKPRVGILISAVFFAIALQIKALVLPALLPMACSLLNSKDVKASVKLMMAWGLSVVMASILILYFTGYELSFASQLQGGAAAKSVDVQSFAKKFYQLIRYVTVPSFGVIGYIRDTLNWPLFFFSTATLAFGVFAVRSRSWFKVAAWWATSVFVLLIHEPIWEHHLILISPAIALSLGGITEWAWSCRQLFYGKLTLAFTVLILGIAVRGSLGPAYFFSRATEAWNQDMGRLVLRVRETLPPEKLVLSDEPFLVAAADRNTHPHLIDVSRVRIASGSLTCKDFLDILDQEEIGAVILEKRFNLIPCPEGSENEIKERFPQEESFGYVKYFYR